MSQHEYLSIRNNQVKIQITKCLTRKYQVSISRPRENTANQQKFDPSNPLKLS